MLDAAAQRFVRHLLLQRQAHAAHPGVAFLRAEKPADKHVIVTGRNAKPELIEIADLVTEMTLVKHPFRQGIKAQKGIEY